MSEVAARINPNAVCTALSAVNLASLLDTSLLMSLCSFRHRAQKKAVWELGGGRGQQPHDVVSGPWWGISQHCACREAGVWFSLGKRERRCWGEVCKCAAGWEERSSGRMRWHSARHPAPAEKGDAHVTGPTGQMARRQGRERPHCAVELPHLLLSWTQRTMLC